MYQAAVYIDPLRRLKYLHAHERRRVLERAKQVCVDVAPPGSYPGYGEQEATEAARRLSIAAVLS